MTLKISELTNSYIYINTVQKSVFNEVESITVQDCSIVRL